MPVLMYHHFVEEGPVGADTVVSAQRFEEQMRTLQESGYTAITAEDLIHYVDGVGTLPEKPIMITMDDGYTSNLEIAAPILERYGMKATVFVIGINVGKTEYPHSGQRLDPPRFSWEQARPWVEKGVICIQSHTYDMHQRADYGFSGRDGMLSLESESELDYRAALKADLDLSRDGLEQGLGIEMKALAFPFGLYTPEAVEVLEQEGVRISFVTQFGCSRAVPGRKNSTQCMERWGVNDAITGERLLQGLEQLKQRSSSLKWG